MDTLHKIGASAANLGIVEATRPTDGDLLSTIFQLITTAVTVWYLIKKPKPKADEPL